MIRREGGAANARSRRQGCPGPGLPDAVMGEQPFIPIGQAQHDILRPHPGLNFRMQTKADVKGQPLIGADPVEMDWALASSAASLTALQAQAVGVQPQFAQMVRPWLTSQPSWPDKDARFGRMRRAGIAWSDCQGHRNRPPRPVRAVRSGCRAHPLAGWGSGGR